MFFWKEEQNFLKKETKCCICLKERPYLLLERGKKPKRSLFIVFFSFGRSRLVCVLLYHCDSNSPDCFLCLVESETLEAGGWRGTSPAKQEVCDRGGHVSARHVLPGHHPEWGKLQPQILHCQVRGVFSCSWFCGSVCVF